MTSCHACEQQLKGVRILAELFRVRELRARISGTGWYDKLLTLVSQTSAADGVTASERYCLKLTLVRWLEPERGGGTSMSCVRHAATASDTLCVPLCRGCTCASW